MNLVTLVKDWFGLVAVVIGLVSAIGFSVSAPWPAKADIKAFKQAAKELNIPIVSGGDWKTFRDFPHIELSRAVYK